MGLTPWEFGKRRSHLLLERKTREMFQEETFLSARRRSNMSEVRRVYSSLTMKCFLVNFE